MSRFPNRPLAATLLAAGVVVVPTAGAIAAEAAAGGSQVSKAQVEYAERRADPEEPLRGDKARIEYQERMAQRREALSSSTSPDAVGLPTGAVVGLVGLGVIAAGGTVLVVRRQQARPRTT